MTPPNATVAYTVLPSPLGRLLAALTADGLAAVLFVADGVGEAVQRLAERLSARTVEDPSRLAAVRDQLDGYFAGARTAFDLPLDWSLVGDGFARRVLHVTARIPHGQVATYGDVAAAAGNPRAARAAGNALGANPLAIVVPCHRVVRRGGDVGGYTGGAHLKHALLALEGALQSAPRGPAPRQ